MEAHPRLKEAQARLDAARAQLAATETRVAEAEAAVRAAEEAAAEGRRDDRALRQARERVDSQHSELRIAAIAVRRATERYDEEYNACCREGHAALHEMHEAAIFAMDAGLQEARKFSIIAAALEDQSRRLLPCGPYGLRTRPGRPVRQAAWRQQFGRGGFYETWRKCCGIQFPG
jgi:hypothetical protein